jgi:protein phosphatase
MAYSYECFAVTHIGNERKNNEDNFFIGELISPNEQSLMSQFEIKSYTKSIVADGGKNRIIAVSDGMGGHEFGEVASYYVVNALDEFSFEHNQASCHNRKEKFEYIQSFQKMVNQTNQKINGFASNMNVADNMGATLSGVILFSDEVVTFNVGDSSTFVFERNKLRKLTTDDNEAEMIGSTRTMKLEVNGKRLTKYFGFPASSGVLTATISKPLSLKLGQIYVIVSDGLTDSLSQDSISLILAKNSDNIETAVNRLLAAALSKDGGGRDNITIVLLKITKPTNQRSKNNVRN